jgi:hypothetical protein
MPQAIVDNATSEPLIEDVAECIDIYSVFVFDFTREKPKLFTSFHCRAGQNDAFNPA